MAKGSSKKVARVAKVGGKAGVRTTRPLGYPLSVAALIVIGLALVTFVKVNRTAQDNTAPRATITASNGAVTRQGDHFHEAIGFYVCGKWVPNLKDAATAGDIHTLGDGIISIEPTSSATAGKNARLKLFLSDVGVTLTNDSIEFPGGVKIPGGGSTTTTTTTPSTTTTKPGETSTSTATTVAPTTTTSPPQTFATGAQCDGKPAVLRVAEWTKSFGGDGKTPTTAPPDRIYKSNFGNIRLDNDLASLTVYYGPEDAKIPVPESTPNLLHLQDLNQSTTSTTTPAVPGVPSGATPGTSPPATSTPATSAPATSAPAASPTTVK